MPITLTLAMSNLKTLNPFTWMKLYNALDEPKGISRFVISPMKENLKNIKKELDVREQDRYSHRTAFCDETDVL